VLGLLGRADALAAQGDAAGAKAALAEAQGLFPEDPWLKARRPGM
jgi:hypothetical protein